MDTLVSIIIPAYNAAPFISETIQSVQNQSYQHWELIIVDDGSKDDTQAVVQPFYEDSRINYFRKENAGVSIARNTGFEKSSGTYLAFLDADDVWRENRLEKMLKRFGEDEDLGLVHSYVQEIDQDSHLLETIHKGKEGYILDSLLLWDGCNIPAPSSILVKREVVDNIGGFSPELSTAADQEFFFRVASQYKIGMVKEVLGLYRMHDKNMHKNIQHMEEDHVRAYLLANQHQLFKSPSFKKKCFANLYYILGNSWWVNGQNKWKGVKFWGKALINNPLIAERFIKKLLSV